MNVAEMKWKIHTYNDEFGKRVGVVFNKVEHIWKADDVMELIYKLVTALRRLNFIMIVNDEFSFYEI